jgi:hypothetical protein
MAYYRLQRQCKLDVVRRISDKAARVIAIEFLRTWPCNFIAKQWISKMTAFENSKMTKTHFQNKKTPSVFSPSPIEAAFARQNDSNTLSKCYEKLNINFSEDSADDLAKDEMDDEDVPEEIADEEFSEEIQEANMNEDDVEEVEAEDNGPPVATKKKRAFQHVSTLDMRRTVVSWMVNESLNAGDKNIVSRAVQNFPNHFRAN